MSNNQAGGCGRQRNRGCLNSLGARGWVYPPCGYEDRDGDGDWRERRCGFHPDRGPEPVCGIFTASIPMAVAANGVVPLINSSFCGDMQASNGLITLNRGGTYLATVTARVPAGTAVNTTLTLNANDASQYSALMELSGEGPTGASAQALFNVCDRTVVSLRSGEALNITEASPQPLLTLSLVKID